MPTKSKKKRIDKFYIQAKEQGYRARSAFKLIQLDKKYQFLSNARACIDLCAAPGGWMQVARKYMPVSSVVIGVDLFPIKPIRGCIALQQDITTPQCRAELRRHMRDWKVDVVLHDGAPNMGSAWLHDAFTQSELTLHALKLACEFLMPDGTFVSKVFRSADYNALYWVFTQLFRKVEATKPSASRNVSAEIYVVCQGFLAPKKIDPRMLNPKHVFKDITQAPNTSVLLDAKRQRHNKNGYDDNQSQLMHKSACVTQFIDSGKPSVFLGTVHELTFDASVPLATNAEGAVIGGDGHALADEHIVPKSVRTAKGKNVETAIKREAARKAAEKMKSDNEFVRRSAAMALMTREAAIAFYLAHPKTPEGIKHMLRDIRMLTKVQLKQLLLWRERMVKARETLVEGMLREQANLNRAADDTANDGDDERDSEDELDAELDAAIGRAGQRDKRRLRKLRRQRAKQHMRAAFGMDVGFEAEEDANDGLFNRATLDRTDEATQRAVRHGLDNLLDKRTVLQEARDEETEIRDALRFRTGVERTEEDSEAEYMGALDDQLEGMYEDYKEAARLREATARSKKLRGVSRAKRLALQQEYDEAIRDEERAEMQARSEIEAEARFGGKLKRKKRRRGDVSSDSSSDELDDEEMAKLDKLSEIPATTRAAMWFDQGLFEGLQEEEDARQANVDAKTKQTKAGGGGVSALERADQRRAAQPLVSARTRGEPTLESILGSDAEDSELSFESRLKRDPMRDLRVDDAEEHDDDDDDSSSDDRAAAPKTKRELEREAKHLASSRGRKSSKAKQLDKGEAFEVVPLSESEEDSDSDAGGHDAQLEALAYARALVNGRRQRAELEDNAFNRRAFADTEMAPDWFVAEEREHNYSALPLTKEDLIAVRQQEIALNARPIKRIIEAKMRKQRKNKRRIERMKSQANEIADQDDLDDKTKMRMLERLYKGTKKVVKPNKVYMVANRSGKNRRATKGSQNGKIVTVDPRMKADKRGAKASANRKRKKYNNKKYKRNGKRR